MVAKMIALPDTTVFPANNLKARSKEVKGMDDIQRQICAEITSLCAVFGRSAKKTAVGAVDLHSRQNVNDSVHR